MFGYVKTYANELKLIEQKHYKAIYCGLCKKLGESYGQASRLTLSYDFAFLSLFEIATSDDALTIENESCIVNLINKKPILKKHPALQYSADTAMLMVYYKIVDDIKDSKIFKKIFAFLLKPIFYFAKKKAAKRIPDVDNYIKISMEEQFKLEKSNCKNIDEAAMPTSKSLGYICEYIAKDEKDKKVYNYFGYNLGKWIYLMDAADDYFDDEKDSSYNVFVNAYGGKLSILDLKEKVTPILNMLRAEIINAYHLINIKRYKSLLDNILFLGLEHTQHSIFIPKEDSKNKALLDTDLVSRDTKL